MNYLRKQLFFAVVSSAMLLRMFVTASQAQWSFSVSYGQPYYRSYSRHYVRRPRYLRRYRPRYYVREYRPVYYRTYSTYRTYPVTYVNNNNGYYYVKNRRKHKKHRKHHRRARYYSNVRYW